MVEGTLTSYDPLHYYVNKVTQLNPAIVNAHKNDDKLARENLLSKSKGDFDIFICVNHHWHGSVLCVPCGRDSLFEDMLSDDPFQVPEQQLCWMFHLCFEDMKLRTYKIEKLFRLYKDITKSIKETFYIGRFRNMSVNALEFSALRAAPHRYNHIINDCVEFAKEFCIASLSYCSNGLQLEEQVFENIKKASATGFSIERLSRRNYLSGLIGNVSLGGMDTSNLFSGKWVWLAVLVFLLVYGVVVASATAFIMLRFAK